MMAKPVLSKNDWIYMEVIGFLRFLTFLQRLLNGFRLAQLVNAAADTAKPMCGYPHENEIMQRMWHSMYNLERLFMPHNASLKIPFQCLGNKRCKIPSSDEIRLYCRIQNERNEKEDDRTIQRENASLRQRVICSIFINRERRVVFIPCGHLRTCEVCGQGTSVCPACGLRVTSRLVVKR
ncbi:E3 ubiquitin-protein ligase MIB1-like [Dreissena polymorpha]|uniref:RING-type domain-containing protein n=1 Tax=Dreissena polymorpha TaxID=45954 RepID=A0A9D4CGQ4_DREPO|nr:E3 ubiquitin-protein ligase MIB1-like [Dreissena polymorpha]KAH3724394.1 hypothetical protein DPMN_050211 [Dreissena polymorpha]